MVFLLEIWPTTQSSFCEKTVESSNALEGAEGGGSDWSEKKVRVKNGGRASDPKVKFKGYYTKRGKGKEVLTGTWDEVGKNVSEAYSEKTGPN